MELEFATIVVAKPRQFAQPGFRAECSVFSDEQPGDWRPADDVLVSAPEPHAPPYFHTSTLSPAKTAVQLVAERAIEQLAALKFATLTDYRYKI
jgi:hypothetical protein